MSSPLQNNITNLQNLLDRVNALPEEVVLPELTNPADASKALSGYEFINEDGEKVTGTIPTKTASDLTASGATVTIPSGYYATQATKSVATATQATPSVSIDSAGKITATATQTAGYVSAGTKTGTKQLTTQAAKTITPTKSSQTAVSSGVYTTGAVMVAAIPSQYVDNSSVTAVENDVMSGKKFGANGSVKTGTFSLDTELSEQDDLIAQIQTALANKAGGVVLPELSNPATAENLEEGYELIDGDGNVVVGTHVCEGGSGGGDGYYIFVKHNLPPDNVFVANGVICPSDTTTKVQVDTFNFISFYFSYWDSPVEDIIVTYESEGDFGVEIYDCSVNWTAPMNNPLYCGITDACNENETLEFNIVYQEV